MKPILHKLICFSLVLFSQCTFRVSPSALLFLFHFCFTFYCLAGSFFSARFFLSFFFSCISARTAALRPRQSCHPFEHFCFHAKRLKTFHLLIVCVFVCVCVWCWYCFFFCLCCRCCCSSLRCCCCFVFDSLSGRKKGEAGESGRGGEKVCILNISARDRDGAMQNCKCLAEEEAGQW